MFVRVRICMRRVQTDVKARHLGSSGRGAWRWPWQVHADETRERRRVRGSSWARVG